MGVYVGVGIKARQGHSATEIISCPNTDKVRTTDMTSTHLQPRDDLSRDKSGKRKFTPSLKVVKQHAIPLTSTHRKWLYKQFDRDAEFEQSKHFKLCQRDIEHTSEQILIHHAAYQFSLTTIREPFRIAYEEKAKHLLALSKVPAIASQFQRERRLSYPDPINEAIWWQKKFIQEMENTKLFPQYNFIEQTGNFEKNFDYDSQNDNPITRRDFPRQGYFGRTRFPENQWDPEDEPFRRTYDWPPDYSFQHRQEIKSYSSSSSANEIYRTRSKTY